MWSNAKAKFHPKKFIYIKGPFCNAFTFLFWFLIISFCLWFSVYVFIKIKYKKIVAIFCFYEKKNCLVNRFLFYFISFLCFFKNFTYEIYTNPYSPNVEHRMFFIYKSQILALSEDPRFWSYPK